MELVCVIVGIGGLGILGIWMHFRRGGDLLEDWARENGYEIISAEYRHMMKGPFVFRSGQGNAVYRIRVRDREGNERAGYARCGGYFRGMWLSRSVTAEWD